MEGLCLWVGRLAQAQSFKLIQQAKEYFLEYIQDYLVNKFLKSMNVSRAVVLAVNAVMSLDAANVLRFILAYYGIDKFLSAVFWVSLIL